MQWNFVQHSCQIEGIQPQLQLQGRQKDRIFSRDRKTVRDIYKLCQGTIPVVEEVDKVEVEEAEAEELEGSDQHINNQR